MPEPLLAHSPDAPGYERKSFSLAAFKVLDAPKGIIEAIVAVFDNVDSGNDRIKPGFFTASLARKYPKGVWMHDWKIPVAITLEARELQAGDGYLPEEIRHLGGLYIKGQFNLGTQRGREAFSDLEFGTIDEFSIGYIASKTRTEAKSGIRDLIEGRIIEWSPVLIGMNDQTTLLSAKGAPNMAGIATKDDTMNEGDDTDGAALTKCAPGVMVKWDYTENKVACKGFGKIKAVHAKGDPMPEDVDNDTEYAQMHGLDLDDDGPSEGTADGQRAGHDKPVAKADRAATGKPGRPACPQNAVTIKCYGMKGGKWSHNGRHELHHETKMTVLCDGLPAEGPDAADAIDKPKAGPFPALKYMMDGPCYPICWSPPREPVDPFDGWDVSAVLSAFNSLDYRYQSARCSLIASDVLTPTEKGERLKTLHASYGECLGRITTLLLEDERMADLAIEATKSQATLARLSATASEAHLQTKDAPAVAAGSFDSCSRGLVADLGEFVSLAGRFNDQRTKAGRVLSDANRKRIGAVRDAANSAVESIATLVTDLDSLLKEADAKPAPGAAEGADPTTSDAKAILLLKAKARCRALNLGV